MVFLMVTMYNMKVWGGGGGGGASKDKNLSVKKYLNSVKPYLSDMINNHKTKGTWRINSGKKRIEHKT